MIQKRNGSVVERKEWKPCMFERDGAGNVIWRLPKEVRNSNIDCYVLVEFYDGIVDKKLIFKWDLSCRVVVISGYKQIYNDTHKMKGAYCFEDFKYKMNIINKLHNIK